MPRWFAMFSQTGGELKSIMKNTGKCPDAILTNNLESKAFKDMIQHRPQELYNYLIESAQPGDMITLHGYLRVIPQDVLEQLKDVYIVNGHPAPIEDYPELKGKDPQERLIKGILAGEYSCLGATLHEVVAEVDAGKVIKAYAAAPLSNTYEGLWSELYQLSIELWTDFIKEVEPSGENR